MSDANKENDTLYVRFKRFNSHPAVFAGIYIFGMLATYILPYFGSNSAVVYVALGNNPFFWIHLFVIILLIDTAWNRGAATGRPWLVIFPILAGVFDLIPGISLIPFIPTVMHLIAVIVGVMGKRISNPVLQEKTSA